MFFFNKCEANSPSEKKDKNPNGRGKNWYYWFIDKVLGWTLVISAGLAGLSQYVSTDDFIKRCTVEPFCGIIKQNQEQICNWGLIFLAATFLVSIIKQLLMPSIENLKKENEKLQNLIDSFSKDCFQLFDGNLFHITKTYLNDPPDNGCNDRITLFIYDRKNKRFVPAGRYSPNTAFQRYGKPDYSPDEGILREIWEKKFCHENTLPNYQDNPDAYLKIQSEKYGLDEATVKNLTMKSRSYFGVRIPDPRDTHGGLGAIIVESLEPNRYIKKNLKQILENESERLGRTISRLEPYIETQIYDMPREIARERGL